MSANQAAIVGWGHTKFGKLDDISFEELVQAAAREAIEDAGIEARDIDAVWLSHYNSGMIPDGFCSSMILGSDPALRFKPAIRCENACASGSAAIQSALDAVASGRVRVALVVGAEKMSALDTSGITRALGAASYQREEAGMSFPQIFAEFAKSYAAKYVDPTEAMAHIAVKNHDNAFANPLAQMHRRFDLDFCRTASDKNPLIADPLKLSDCSLVSDGAAAIVIVNKDMISDFRRAVGFRAFEQVSDLLPLSAKQLADFEGPSLAFHRAYEAAGIGVGDLSVAEVRGDNYDGRLSGNYDGR